MASAAVAVAAVFGGTPISNADPYDDDDGGSSYSDDGGGDSGDSGGGMEEPDGGGMEEPADTGGGESEESGGGMAGGEEEEPGGGGMHSDPTPRSGGMAGGEEQEGGGMADGDEPGGGGMATPGEGGGMGGDEPGGGGMATDPTPAGGGMATPGEGGGMSTDEGGGMSGPAEGGGMANADRADVTTASSSQVASTTSTVASSEQISSYRESITSSFSSSGWTTGLSLTSPVTRWNGGWTSYDPFYRPVLTNPYRMPMDVLYDYGGQTQVVTIPPLQRAAVDVPNPGVYSFTSMTRPASGPATNVAVGSFSGGGFKPAPGQAPPQKPAKLTTNKGALVQVKFDRGASEPFKVKSLTDLGPDATMKGATKVLLDGEIPSWGQWSTTAGGEKLFVINETQLLPGVNPPAQEPLPGYNVKLTSSSKSTSWIAEHQTALIGAAVGAGVLALAAVGLIMARRRGGTDA